MRALARLALGTAVLGAGACRSFPAALLVPDEVRRELETTRWVERPWSDPPAGLLELVGPGLEPARASGGGGAALRRLDLPGSAPLSPARAAREGSPALEGLVGGELVLARNATARGLAQHLALAEPTRFDHAGLLVHDADGWFVYEAWPRLSLIGCYPDFAARWSGRVARRPLRQVLARYDALEVVRLPVDAAALQAAARASLRAPARFDPYHRPGDDALSCTEYVEVLLRAVGWKGDLHAFPRTPNASASRVAAALGYRSATYESPDAFLRVPGARIVARLDRARSASEALAVEAALRWLHESFHDDARLGDYLAFDGFRLLRYRANVASFLAWARAVGGARGVGDEAEAAAFVGALAPWFFVRAAG